MKKNILSSLMILGVLIGAVSCTPKKIIVKAPPAKDTTLIGNSKENYVEILKDKNLNFNTLSLKGKAQLNIAGDENNVTLNIRIKKDEKIWFSVSALGGALEAARGIITPDSIMVMNRLQRTILRKPLSYIYDYTNPQINFSWLQSILSGNTLNDLLNIKSNLVKQEGVWNMKGTEKGLAYSILFNTLLKTQQLNLNDAQAGQALKVVYDAYTPVNQGLFPSFLKINSKAGNKNIAVSVDFVKIDANVPVDFPFSVPRSYELIH